MRWMLVVTAVVVGCGKDAGAPTSGKSAQDPGGTLAGIWPRDWTCDKVATLDEVGAILGAPARQFEGVIQTNGALPKPCNYSVTGPMGEVTWTFDLDCRDNYKETADAMMAQWTQASTDSVNQYNIVSDAAPVDVPKPHTEPGTELPDARPPGKAPEGAREVAVGRKAVDVLGQGIIFIDDDAPCYARVVGPDADKRLALAQHVAQRLTFLNAPMTPRAAE